MRITVVLGLLLAVSGAAFAAESSCVDCHKSPKTAAAAPHSVDDWRQSAHAKAGIGCEACHGGDPAGKDRPTAHAGLLPSTDEKSRIYYKNIPDTCGACHQEELKAFKTSVHYKKLEEEGRGPNCATCHGSMANHVLSPEQMQDTCTLCHHIPTNAYAAATALEQTRSALKRLERGLAAAKKKGAKGLEPIEADYTSELADHKTDLAQWHAFETDKVAAAAQAVTKKTMETLEKLRAADGGGK
jgi:hypothetical protein